MFISKKTYLRFYSKAGKKIKNFGILSPKQLNENQNLCDWYRQKIRFKKIKLCKWSGNVI